MVEFARDCAFHRFDRFAFGAWRSLKSICIPATIEFIGGGCFVPKTCYYRPNAAFFPPLELVTFEPGSKLREIDALAFFRCIALKSITVPASLEKISGQSFAQSGLRHIAFEDRNPRYHSSGSFVMDATDHNIVCYFGREAEVPIADEIFVLGKWCFADCEFLANVTFGPDSQLALIEDAVFKSCVNLQVICIPASVTALGQFCFSHCERITCVRFEEHSQLATVGWKVFEWCELLPDISFPASLHKLEFGAFMYCRALQKAVFENGSKLTKLPDDVFGQCGSLQLITVPASVEVIGIACFTGCEKLAEVVFERDSKLVRIGDKAFCACRNLTSFWVQGSVEFIGQDCFSGCGALASLEFARPSRLREFLDIPPRLRGLTEIPDSVERLLISGRGAREVEAALDFGRDSKLERFEHYLFEGGGWVRSFARLSCRTLKAFRNQLEFPAGAEPPGARMQGTTRAWMNDWRAQQLHRIQFSP
jgi:hypothetical protein